MIDERNIAIKLIENSKNTILLKYRLFSFSLFKLETIRENQRMKEKIKTIATDGKNIYFNNEYIIRLYKKDNKIVNRTIMHIMLHCLFMQLFDCQLYDRVLWNLACDINMESIIDSMNDDVFDDDDKTKRKLVYDKLVNSKNSLLVHNIYEFLQNNDINIDDLIPLFKRDEHDLWYFLNIKNSEDNKKEWQEIANIAKIEIENFSQNYGNLPLGLRESLFVERKKTHDYRRFLKKYFSFNEVMKVDTDSFDYLYYTLGLNMYGNIPLIEYNEFKEEKTIEDFVIMIDASGSTYDTIAKKFLEEIWMLVDTSANSRMNLYIIQCDCEIQTCDNITSIEDFRTYIDKFQLVGCGGTDFVPAFNYIDELIENKKLKNLKGMIYFTDGYGSFPKKAKPYDVIFAYYEKEMSCNNYCDIPNWITLLIIDEKSIMEKKQ